MHSCTPSQTTNKKEEEGEGRAERKQGTESMSKKEENHRNKMTTREQIREREAVETEAGRGNNGEDGEDGERGKRRKREDS